MASGTANPLPSFISRMPGWSWDWNKQHCLASHCDESPVKLYYGSSCCLTGSVLLTCEIFRTRYIQQGIREMKLRFIASIRARICSIEVPIDLYNSRFALARLLKSYDSSV
jgi:hypothetical protein